MHNLLSLRHDAPEVRLAGDGMRERNRWAPFPPQADTPDRPTWRDPASGRAGMRIRRG